MPCTIGFLIHACKLSYRLNHDGTIDTDIEKDPSAKLKSYTALLKSDYTQIAGIKPKTEGGEGESPLAAIALKSKNPQDPIIIAFRGTKSIQDMKSNFSIVRRGLATQHHLDGAMAFYKKIQAENPDSQIILAGHSLGGHIAKYVHLKAHEEGISLPRGIAVRTFNTAPDSTKYVRKFANRPEIEESVKNIRVSQDPISAIGLLKYYGDTFSFKSRAKNMLDAHMLWSIDENLPQSFKDTVVSPNPNHVIYENLQGMINSYECRVTNQFFSSFRMGKKNFAILQQLQTDISPLITSNQFAEVETKIKDALTKVSGKVSVGILQTIEKQLKKIEDDMQAVKKTEKSPSPRH